MSEMLVNDTHLCRISVAIEYESEDFQGKLVFNPDVSEFVYSPDFTSVTMDTKELLALSGVINELNRRFKESGL
jgi:hypothetical protein